MSIKKRNLLIQPSLVTISLTLLFIGNTFALDTTEEYYDLKLLGKYVFFDKISNPQRMACVTCHDPATGGTGSISGVNLHQVGITGANPHTTGDLKPPTNAYASFIPPFRINVGGNFWNGRAEGNSEALFDGATKHIGDEVFQGSTNPVILGYAKYFGGTSDQALNPMPNPVEQNIDRQSVCQHVASAKYAELYQRAWGEAIDCSNAKVSIVGSDVTEETEFDISFKRLMLAVGAWQHSSDLNSFSSKLDEALKYEKEVLGENPPEFPLGLLTDEENKGHDLFYGRPNGCARFCHNSGSIGQNRTDEKELYTANLYFNIGIPANTEVPGFDPAKPNLGLYDHTGVDGDQGKFKTPTMRNVDKRKGKGFTKAYGHNGWFKSLESIVHFYNTRDVKPRCPGHITTEKQALQRDCWPAPEVPETATRAQGIGNMGFSPEEEAAIVAYLKTLTDTHTPTQPAPYKSSKK